MKSECFKSQQKHKPFFSSKHVQGFHYAIGSPMLSSTISHSFGPYLCFANCRWWYGRRLGCLLLVYIYICVCVCVFVHYFSFRYFMMEERAHDSKQLMYMIMFPSTGMLVQDILFNYRHYLVTQKTLISYSRYIVRFLFCCINIQF